MVPPRLRKPSPFFSQPRSSAPPQEAESLGRTFPFLFPWLSPRLHLERLPSNDDDTTTNVVVFYYSLSFGPIGGSLPIAALPVCLSGAPLAFAREFKEAERRERFADRMAPLRPAPLSLLVLAVITLREGCFGGRINTRRGEFPEHLLLKYLRSRVNLMYCRRLR